MPEREDNKVTLKYGLTYWVKLIKIYASVLVPFLIFVLGGAVTYYQIYDNSDLIEVNKIESDYKNERIERIMKREVEKIEKSYKQEIELLKAEVKEEHDRHEKLFKEQKQLIIDLETEMEEHKIDYSQNKGKWDGRWEFLKK